MSTSDYLPGQEIRLFSIASRRALVSTQPNIRWVMRSLATETKRLIAHLQQVSKLTMHGAIYSLSYVPSWCGTAFYKC
jgi:hypothetical protein